MLGKLIKYEFKATARIILPIYIVVIFFAALCKVTDGFGNKLEDISSTISHLAQIIGIAAYVFAMIGLVAGILILIIVRFYKNLLCDEGYLMNTLPVSVHNLIISKLIVTAIWIMFSTIVGLLSIVIVTFDLGIVSDIAKSIPHAISRMKNELKIHSILPFVISIGILMVLEIFKSVLMIYSSICIGQLINKYKLLLSFVAFIAFRSIESTLSSVVMFELSISNKFNVPSSTIFGFIFTIIGIEIILISSYYFCCHYIISKKLNLE